MQLSLTGGDDDADADDADDEDIDDPPNIFILHCVQRSPKQAERLVFLRRSLARARIQSLELESQRAQQERALAEAYAQRRENQIAQRREERQARLRELQEKARPPPRSPELEVEKDPEISALLAQRPSLKKRLRPPLQNAVLPPCSPRSPRSPHSAHSVSANSSPSPRKPAVPKPPPQRAAARMPEEAPSAQQPQMPRKEHLRATQHQLLKSCGVVVYKQQMKAHFRRILEAVEVGYGASAGHQKKPCSNGDTNQSNPASTRCSLA
ncbi:CTSC [Symbiodinium sp. CCMP2592]|nr:CTSC [Symbiodinium sp. CCMP2592]